MVSHPRTPRIDRLSRLWRASAAALGLIVLLPATATAEAGSSTHGDKTEPEITDVVEVDGDVPVSVKLNCHGHVAEGEGTVGCGWRSETDEAVATWQLWNLQVRPEGGVRNLVTELGADVRSYRDTNVVVPAVYAYAIVGLDADGSIVARSRPARAVLHERDRGVRHLGLRCHAHGVRLDAVTDQEAVADPEVLIECGWRATGIEAAVGYQLWRAVDRGEREIIAETGLDQISYEDQDVSVGHRYRYVVVAVDADGLVVGRSRAEAIILRSHDAARDRMTDEVRDHEGKGDHEGVRAREGEAGGDAHRDRRRGDVAPDAAGATADEVPVVFDGSVGDRTKDHTRDCPVDAEHDHAEHDEPTVP